MLQERYNLMHVHIIKGKRQNAQKKAFVKHKQIAQMYEEDTTHAPARPLLIKDAFSLPTKFMPQRIYSAYVVGIRRSKKTSLISLSIISFTVFIVARCERFKIQKKIKLLRRKLDFILNKSHNLEKFNVLLNLKFSSQKSF